MKKSNIYTRTGDEGMTSLVGGQRVSKTHVRLEAYGTLDELNSQIGLLITYLTDEKDRNRLIQIQCDLFSVGSILATDTSERAPKCCITPEIISDLENAIDEADAPLGGWRGFILPGGTRGAAVAHVCRTVCRRLERRMYAVAEVAEIDPLLFQYVNRLSDYFFVLSKKINKMAGVEENFWRNR